MPDSFFAASKPRKRKRPATSDVSKPPRKDVSSSKAKQKPTGPRSRDEELESDQTDEDDDLRHDEDAYITDEEDENETPAQKRLRLAQLYIDSVKNDMRSGRSN
jgi:ribosomal RNA-processing protein 9